MGFTPTTRATSFSILKNNRSWNTADIVFLSRFTVGINICFFNAVFVAISFSKGTIIRHGAHKVGNFTYRKTHSVKSEFKIEGRFEFSLGKHLKTLNLHSDLLYKMLPKC